MSHQVPLLSAQYRNYSSCDQENEKKSEIFEGCHGIDVRCTKTSQHRNAPCSSNHHGRTIVSIPLQEATKGNPANSTKNFHSTPLHCADGCIDQNQNQIPQEDISSHTTQDPISEKNVVFASVPIFLRPFISLRLYQHLTFVMIFLTLSCTLFLQFLLTKSLSTNFYNYRLAFFVFLCGCLFLFLLIICLPFIGIIKRSIQQVRVFSYGESKRSLFSLLRSFFLIGLFDCVGFACFFLSMPALPLLLSVVVCICCSLFVVGFFRIFAFSSKERRRCSRAKLFSFSWRPFLLSIYPSYLGHALMLLGLVMVIGLYLDRFVVVSHPVQVVNDFVHHSQAKAVLPSLFAVLGSASKATGHFPFPDAEKDDDEDEDSSLYYYHLPSPHSPSQKDVFSDSQSQSQQQAALFCSFQTTTHNHFLSNLLLLLLSLVVLSASFVYKQSFLQSTNFQVSAFRHRHLSNTKSVFLSAAFFSCCVAFFICVASILLGPFLLELQYVSEPFYRRNMIDVCIASQRPTTTNFSGLNFDRFNTSYESSVFDSSSFAQSIRGEEMKAAGSSSQHSTNEIKTEPQISSKESLKASLSFFGNLQSFLQCLFYQRSTLVGDACLCEIPWQYILGHVLPSDAKLPGLLPRSALSLLQLETLLFIGTCSLHCFLLLLLFNHPTIKHFRTNVERISSFVLICLVVVSVLISLCGFDQQLLVRLIVSVFLPFYPFAEYCSLTSSSSSLPLHSGISLSLLLICCACVALGIFFHSYKIPEEPLVNPVWSRLVQLEEDEIKQEQQQIARTKKLRDRKFHQSSFVQQNARFNNHGCYQSTYAALEKQQQQPLLSRFH